MYFSGKKFLVLLTTWNFWGIWKICSPDMVLTPCTPMRKRSSSVCRKVMLFIPFKKYLLAFQMEFLYSFNSASWIGVWGSLAVDPNVNFRLNCDCSWQLRGIFTVKSAFGWTVFISVRGPLHPRAFSRCMQFFHGNFLSKTYLIHPISSHVSWEQFSTDS